MLFNMGKKATTVQEVGRQCNGLVVY